jgi:hypothetical protein
MIISQNSNDVYYAYTRGRFWRWDESAHVWRESHLLAQKFGKAKTVEKRLTPETFLTSDEFIPMDDYELPDQMLTALRDAKPCRDAPIEPVEESLPHPRSVRMLPLLRKAKLRHPRQRRRGQALRRRRQMLSAAPMLRAMQPERMLHYPPPPAAL